MSVPIPEGEEQRLDELESYDILDTAPEPIYEDLCFLASSICGTDIAAITLIDEDRQWFKAERGLEGDETSREDGFCAHAITDPDEVMIVEDAREDERFVDNPYVQDDPNIRFYAGAPLRTAEGHGLGTICAIDDEPRSLTEEQQRGLEALSRMVMTQLDLRRRSLEFRSVKGELEEVNEELRRSNEELDKFASVVSHELKDPIGQVVSNLDLLELDVGEQLDDEARELLQEAQMGAERSADLADDILRYARAGKGTAERQRVDLERVLDQTLESLSRRIEGTDARIEVGRLPDVYGDASLLRQLVHNLVDNAIKYRSGEGPRIEIGAEVEDGMARLWVEDDGIGIPEADHERLFRVFERASNTGEVAGTGVGLALSARIVERHDGEIGVESTEGEGAHFWFTLPLAEEHEASDANSR